MQNQNWQNLTRELEVPLQQNEALQILIDAVNAATMRGAFDILEAGNISTAVKLFTRPQKEQKTHEVVTENGIEKHAVMTGS